MPIYNTTSSVFGASIFGQLPAGTAPLGSVAALQGTNPWNMAGSVAAFQAGTNITSLVSTIPSSVIVGASIFGLPPVNVTNTNLNVSGSVVSFPQGTIISSLVSTVPSSVIVGVSIFGQLPAGTAVLGSVATLQGTLPWAIAGSVLSVPASPSISGTFAEDAAHTGGDFGLFGLGVRNDSASSFVSANLDYTFHALDSAGRTLIKPFISEQGSVFSYKGSVVSASVTLIAASVIGLKSYVTDFWITNTGSVAQLITFQGGDTSLVGFTIAPAGGGSNSPGIAVPLRTSTSQDLAFKATGTSSVIYMTVNGFQAQ